MTKQRRSFSAEFKREASDLVLKQNYSYIEANRLLCAVELIRFKRSAKASPRRAIAYTGTAENPGAGSSGRPP